MQSLQANGAEEAAMKQKNDKPFMMIHYAVHSTTTIQGEIARRASSHDAHERRSSTEMDIPTNYHSWSIQVTRKVNDKTTEVTLEWHLSHMSEYRERNKKIEKNTHTGARFIWVHPTGFVCQTMCLDTMLSWSQNAQYRGHTGLHGRRCNRYNSSGSKKTVPTKFNIDNKIKVEVAEHTIRRRNDRKSMLTLINVVLGACPI